jgi:hypothetical protein
MVKGKEVKEVKEGKKATGCCEMMMKDGGC